MSDTPAPIESVPAETPDADQQPPTLSETEKRRLDLKTEREARHQAQVGRTVRGGD